MKKTIFGSDNSQKEVVLPQSLQRQKTGLLRLTILGGIIVSGNYEQDVMAPGNENKKFSNQRHSKPDTEILVNRNI